MSPLHFLVVFFGILVVAQIVDNLKGILTKKEIESLPSVQFYFKFMYSNYYINSLCAVYSIAQTLGFELEILLSMSSLERNLFFTNIEKRILNCKTIGKVYSKYSMLLDPESLLIHRKGICLQIRNFIVLSSYSMSSTLTLNIPLMDVNLFFLLDSAKMLWAYLGLKTEDFNFCLIKNYALRNKKLLFSEFTFVGSMVQFYRLLLKYEFKRLVFFNSNILFADDFVVLKSPDNLVLLEREVSFIKRIYNIRSKSCLDSYLNLGDFVIKTSYSQRIKFSKKICGLSNT